MRTTLFLFVFAFNISTFSQNPFWQHLALTDSFTVVTMMVTNNGELFAGFSYAGGIYRSTNNGESWMRVWDTTAYHIVYSLAVDSSGRMFAGVWTRTPGPIGIFVGNLLRSTSNGLSWQKLEPGLSGDLALCFAINRSNTIFAGCPNGRIHRSTDHGLSWELLRTANPGDTTIQTFAIDSHDWIYASNFTAGGAGTILRSTDLGNTWTTFAAFGRSVYSLRFAQMDTLYAGTYDAPENDGGLYRTTDHGTTWIQIGLQNTSVSSILINGSRIFSSTYGSGVFFSTDYGSSWNTLNSGLTNLNVRHLCLAPNGFLFAATSGGGVHRSMSPITSVGQFKSQIPTHYFLQQNYPNPFNPFTTIEYFLPTQSFVTLTVFDLLGRRVAVLSSEVQPPGMKSVRFDATEIPSGIYFYRLQTAKFVQTKKMLLVR